MMRCEDCGYTFEEPTYTNWEEDHGDGIIEPWCAKTCPDCGSTAIVDIDIDYIRDSLEELRL